MFIRGQLASGFGRLWQLKRRPFLKPCVGISRRRLARYFALNRPCRDSLRRRIGVQNPREFRQFRDELSWRLNNLSVGGGSVRNRTAETRFCSPVWVGYRPARCQSLLTVPAKPCAGIWPQRPAADLAADRSSIGSLRGRIQVQNPREFRHSSGELSWIFNDLGVGGGPSRNRTGVQGFAVLCVTTPPSGPGAARSLPRRSPSGQPRCFTCMTFG